MYYGEHGAVRVVGEGGEKERETEREREKERERKSGRTEKVVALTELVVALLVALQVRYPCTGLRWAL